MRSSPHHGQAPAARVPSLASSQLWCITVGSSLGDKNTGPHDVGLAAPKLDPTSFIRYPVLGTLLEQG